MAVDRRRYWASRSTSKESGRYPMLFDLLHLPLLYVFCPNAAGTPSPSPTYTPTYTPTYSQTYTPTPTPSPSPSRMPLLLLNECMVFCGLPCARVPLRWDFFHRYRCSGRLLFLEHGWGHRGMHFFCVLLWCKLQLFVFADA